MVIKHGRITQRKQAWARHYFPQHPEMNGITLPVISAYSENQPDAFQKGKIRVVLSNAKLTYGTSTPEGKQQRSAPQARECFLSHKAGTDECDPNGFI